MGAYSIDFEIKGKATKKEILERFREIQDLEKANDDEDQDGYSGDFRTVDDIKFDILNQGTGDYSKDYELVLNKSEKWYHGQAIYTKNKKGDAITLIVAWGAC